MKDFLRITDLAAGDLAAVLDLGDSCRAHRHDFAAYLGDGNNVTRLRLPSSARSL